MKGKPLGNLLETVEEWKKFTEQYGDLEEISLEQAKKLDVHQVWTFWSRSSDFLSNELVEAVEVISYFKSENQWDAEEGSLTFVMTVWVDCETCEANSEDDDWDQDDCEECEGSGVLSITIPDCMDCKTEDEVYARREA